MTRTLLLATLLCVAPALQAQSWQDADDAEEAAWQEQQAAASQAYQLRVAEALSASGEPREQAFAELLRRQTTAADAGTVPAGDLPSRAAPRDPALESRLHAIAARAGDDRLANQFLIAVDRDTGSPLRRAAAQRWQAAEPDNLAALLQVGPPVDDLLAQARNTTHASTHMYDAVRWMSAAFQRHPLTPAELAALSGDAPYHAEEAAAISAIALWSTAMVPSHRVLVDACRGVALRATPARSADCRHVAGVLADRSDSTLDRMVGLSMLRELATDSTERSRVHEQQRSLDWKMMQWGRIAAQQERDGAAQFVRLLRDAGIQNELQLAERVLAEAGVPLQPPAGWMPPRR